MSNNKLSLLVPFALATVICATGTRATCAATAVATLPRRARRARHERQDSHDGHRPTPSSNPCASSATASPRSARTGSPTSRCTRTIDLEGRTAVPGLIDNHNHIVLLGLRPGHDTRLESAASIGDVLATLRAQARPTLPNGEWITSIGGFDINQFVPPPGAPRFPTLAELDSVTPNHPVFIQMSFSGPSVTNTLGKQFFEQAGIEVGADGAIAGGFQMPNPTTRALHELRTAANARGPEARHAGRDALRGELGADDASRRRRLPGDGHGRRRRRALRSLSRLRRAARALRRRRADAAHPH